MLNSPWHLGIVAGVFVFLSGVLAFINSHVPEMYMVRNAFHDKLSQKSQWSGIFKPPFTSVCVFSGAPHRMNFSTCARHRPFAVVNGGLGTPRSPLSPACISWA